MVMGHQIESVHEPERWFAAQTFHSDAEHVGQVIGPAFGAVAAYLGRRGSALRGAGGLALPPRAGRLRGRGGLRGRRPVPRG